ncbi:MAG: helicase-exonuclease AddAB subunit AddB [Syntrophomonas sp.]
MAVRYILGRAGKGKTQLAVNEIKQDLRSHGEHKLLLIVPEQFTLQAERDLITRLNLPGLMRVEVLSFTRLTQRVLNETGGNHRTLINEQGKIMVLRKIIDENRRDLTIFHKAAQQDGFLAKLSRLLSDFKQQDISPSTLRLNLGDNTETEMTRQKLQDIALLYERFNEYLEQRYIDLDDQVNIFLDKIGGLKYIKEARVWIDGFSTFSPRSIKIIERLMGLARDTSISFTLDSMAGKRDHDLFNISRRAYQKIRQSAADQGLPEEFINIDTSKADSIKNPAVLHVEAEFFAYPPRSFEGNALNIEVWAARNQENEIEQLAREILALVKQGYRWNDLAVVCQDMELYGGIIKRVFRDYGIPCFIDQKRDIMNNPVIRLILSTLDTIRRGYRHEDVFNLIKTGFGGLDFDKAEILENYVLEYGIRGKGWKEAFVLGTGEDLEELNYCREIVIKPLESLESILRNAQTIIEYTRALYDYLLAINTREQLAIWIGELRAKGNFEQVNENTQIWNTLMEIFSQLVEILGGQQVSLKEFSRIVEAGFLSFEAGIIPPGVDEVLVGDIQRSKSHDIRGLFMVGVNDGIIPSSHSNEDILSAEDKELLQSRGVDFYYYREMKYEEERFLIYTALTKPQDYLWLSYAQADAEGKGMRPSLLIDRFLKIFKTLNIKTDLNDEPLLPMQIVSTPGGTFKHLITKLRQARDGKAMEGFWWDVDQWYSQNESWQHLRKSVILGLFHHNQPDRIGPGQVQRLFRTPFRSSVSRIEMYVKCPFAHFIHYGLKPGERKNFDVAAPDLGELLHNCLCSFAGELEREKLAWKNIERSQCELIMDRVLDDLVPGYGNGVFSSTHRYRYLVKRLKRIARRAIWTLTEHFQQGDFSVVGHEVRFGPDGVFPAIEIDLENGEKIFLEGRIDRIDFLDAEDTGYIKIIDYKLGNRDFILSDVYHGIALQLMVYLRAVMRNKTGKALKPAGVFYFRIDDPLVSSDEKVTEHIEREIARKLKMKGVVLKDVKVVRQIDRTINGHSEIIPVALNNEEVFYKNSAVLEEENFSALMNHVDNLLKQIAREMLQGQIKIEPVKNQGQKACTYCPYPSVCQFDQLLPDNNYRTIKYLNNDEVIKRISN